MIDALIVAMIAQSSLVLSGAAVYWVHVSDRAIGALAGFGAGAILAAVSFDLIPQTRPLENLNLTIWLLVGAVVYVVSDRIVEKRFGAEPGSGPAPLGIVVGAVVDGIPESAILGIQLAAGMQLSSAFVAAIFVSNVPQALAPSADLRANGWPLARVVTMWSIVLMACAVTGAVGYGVGQISGATGARAAALAAGGLLSMLTDSLMPYSFERGGTWAGIWTVVGFAASLARS